MVYFAFYIHHNEFIISKLARDHAAPFHSNPGLYQLAKQSGKLQFTIHWPLAVPTRKFIKNGSNAV